MSTATQDSTKWTQVRDALQPKTSKYWIETPSITQKAFLYTTAKEVLFGGAAGGGKSSALLMSALQYVDVPNYSAILFRRSFADLALPGALMDRFVQWVSQYEDNEVRWNRNACQATFPSGARITFGYLNHTRDYERYKSSEYQFIGMDEVTELRESDYTYLFSRLRKPKAGPLSKVPLRMRAASNPYPNWVRQRFLVEGKEHGRLFIPSKLEDNPGLDPESYRQSLKELTPIERARLERGDWWATSLGSLVKREDFEVLEEREIPRLKPQSKVVRTWDLAATKPSPSNPDPDWSVGVLAAEQGGKFYILDVRRIRDRGNVVQNLIQETALEDGLNVAIRMEEEPGSAGKNLIEQYAMNVLPGMDFQGIRATGDKITRARPFASAVANGNVAIKIAPWNSAFLDELSAFPEGNDHDDQVDAVVHAFNHCFSAHQRQKLRIVFS